MRKYIAYIRVSTVRQGEKGASLPEQKSVIEGYAQREGLLICQWYEETETAAKVGRILFKKMLHTLERGEAHGLILHKIDRGARNLKDWAALSELSDRGVDVRIAGDALDLNSRGGRLSADIQAVVAADYIRNLREEVKKGQRGRLKQGLYPWGAPLGYTNTGKGMLKTIDPIMGPIVRRAFEEYATGGHTLRTLSKELHKWGLRTKSGKPISLSRVNLLLRRKYYFGLLDVKGSTYFGKHEPLVSKRIFDQVGDVLSGRSSDRLFGVRSYALRRLVSCGLCGGKLYAETQKGHAYFRCHGQACKGTCIRESVILSRVMSDIAAMGLHQETVRKLMQAWELHKSRALGGLDEQRAALALRRAALDDRLGRITDAYIDRLLDKEDFDERKTKLQEEKLTILEDEKRMSEPERFYGARLTVFLELISSLQGLDSETNPSEKGRILKSAISNLSVHQKTVEIQWKTALHLLKMRGGVPVCADAREAHRTENHLVCDLPMDVALEVVESVMTPDVEKAGYTSPTSRRPDVQVRDQSLDLP